MNYNNVAIKQSNNRTMKQLNKMIPFEQAYGIVMESYRTLGLERIDFINTLGRVLAENVVSDMEIPPFTKSAADGFACREQDIKDTLDVIETIAAGRKPEKKIGKNQCARIMTGAMIPEGADCVLMVEDTKEISENKIQYEKESTDINICKKGEDIHEGDIVLEIGTIIKPQHIAILASVGNTSPLVSRRPMVGIISTGDEIVEPYVKPGISQIRNSNSYQLIAQVNRVGAIPNYHGIAEDSEEKTYRIVMNALEENDIVLLTGGVSMGDFDFVADILKKAKIDILFNRVAVQPGKPTTFGVHEKALCFGLPGNPVASFVQFELMVKPLIYKMMGADYEPVNIKMPMGTDYTRTKSVRESLLPVRLMENGTVMPVEYNGSAHIHALYEADGLIKIAVGETKISKGEIVNVRQI